MVSRDISGRYKGSLAGMAWAFVNPVLMLAVYTFVFSIVFGSRWPGATGGRMDFALILFCGLIVFNVFAESVNRAPQLVLAHSNYVKKVVFPLEVLTWVTIFSALFHAAVSLLVLLLVQLLIKGSIPWTIVLVPFVILPVILLTAGFGWFVSSLGVFLRDVAQITTVFTTALMFLSPLFFPLEAVPNSFKPFLALNPLGQMISDMRSVVLYGRVPDMLPYLKGLGISFVVSWAGLAFFMRTKRGFADVL